ncbi:MAG TPA: GMC family oxidoreductase N-terminal domain-containing protein [Steroidobacteraceae bacterium]
MRGLETEFDYVVVGAGSSGCVLANRLSANGSVRVAVIEAGPRDSSFWIHLPIGYGRTMWDPVVNWKFETEPEPNMVGRQIYWPRGRVLGGSSSINGLIVIRGQHEDYDRWARNGAGGWSWNEVRPYFIKIESNADLAGDQLHGSSGPLPVSSIGRRHELIEAFIAAGEANGVPRTEDFNGREQEGAGYFQLTTRNGWRMSAADAYLRPAAKRANVSVLTDTQVLRILFDGSQAIGVACRTGETTRVVKARRGVVLSAGAIQSPQLLMLSGIGPAKHLQEHGVPVLIDRPSVGQNLQDHLQFRMIYRCAKAITTNDALRTLWGRAKLGLEWLLFRTGALAVGINQGGMFARLMANAKTPDIQFHVATLSADIAGGKVHDFSGFTLSVCQLRPESRGHIALASSDPMARPRIFANYLETATDRDYAVQSIGFARKLAGTPPLADLVEAEVTPGPGVRTDGEVLDFARSNGATIFHPSGTCRMGSDEDAVVDPRLRVRGAAGLWVVDCSIMPTLVSGNTNVPAMMIAEKAADMILEDNEEQHLGRMSWQAQPYRIAI